MAQFHFDPDTYLDDGPRGGPRLRHAAGRDRTRRPARSPTTARRACSTSAREPGRRRWRCSRARPDAQLVLVDENPGMLAVARRCAARPRTSNDVVVADLSDPLPEGPFDLVVSALAIHHLDGPAKQALFAGVHARLRAGGRFVMADVVVPDDAADATTPLTADYDKPDRPAICSRGCRRRSSAPSACGPRTTSRCSSRRIASPTRRESHLLRDGDDDAAVGVADRAARAGRVRPR